MVTEGSVSRLVAVGTEESVLPLGQDKGIMSKVIKISKCIFVQRLDKGLGEH